MRGIAITGSVQLVQYMRSHGYPDGYFALSVAAYRQGYMSDILMHTLAQRLVRRPWLSMEGANQFRPPHCM
jgi:hypothetical protein